MGKLGLKRRTGNIIPFMKYNAKLGRFYIRNEDGDEVELNDGAPWKAVADLENIEIGPMKFDKATGPDARLVRAGEEVPPIPDGFKMGFRLLWFGEKSLGGLRELMSTSALVGDAIEELHERFEAEAPKHPGKAPVVQYNGATPNRGSYGTNYRPNFEIVGWVDRPDAFPDVEDGGSGSGPTPSRADAAASILDDDIPF